MENSRLKWIVKKWLEMAIQRDLDCMPFAAAACRQYAKTLELVLGH